MKIVLAYSGGLDTSVALKWLAQHHGAEVIAFCADIGQREDIEEVADRARRTGAAKVYTDNLQEHFIKDYAFRALKAGAKYEGQYLLAAPLSRPLIAERAVAIAKAEAADAVAHGATGKGNDQVRFYCSFAALAPHLKIITPLIDWEMKSRQEEVDYALRHRIPIAITEGHRYSVDTNLWGSSIECGPLDDPTSPPPETIYQMTRAVSDAPDSYDDVAISFDRGDPISLDGKSLAPVQLVNELNEIAGRHGVGRIDIIENRVIGIKTRGVYESPAAAVLHLAHHELEKFVLDRATFQMKTALADTYATLIYDGLWFSPLREALDQFIAYTQQRVMGEVVVRLYKGSATVRSRSSKCALYSNELSTYEAGDIFDHTAGRGFSYVQGLPLRMWYNVKIG